MELFKELKRRNVFRVGIAYIISAWVLMQFVDLVLDNINAPDWVMQVFMLALAIGFPVVLLFAWAFELTPEGIKKEKDVDRSQSIRSTTGRKLDRSIIAILALAVVFLIYHQLANKAGSESEAAKPGRIEQASAKLIPELKLELKPEVKTGESKASQNNARPAEQSVAVLPFVNMSDDQENEYFSDGISEELLNVLVRVKGLRVPSRTTSFTFKGSNKTLAEIGKALQVDHILEGSVRKSNDRIRVTAQLIDVNTDNHLWSKTYTRKLDDIFAVQDEIAAAIVAALKVTLSGKERANLQHKGTHNVAAYNSYLLGRHQWNLRTIKSLKAAVKPLKQATTLDPAYAKAWAALADAYVLMPEYHAGTIKEHIPLAHQAISKALSIDPDSAGALTTSAYIKFMYDYDFSGARAAFEKAIRIDPTYATAHQWFGEMLAVLGQQDAALEQLQLARQLDPLSPTIPHVTGWLLSWSEREDEAFDYFQEALAIDPHFINALGNLVYLNINKGRYDKARELVNEVLALGDEASDSSLALIDALENPALKSQALSAIANDKRMGEGALFKGLSYMLLDEPDLALDSIEKAFAAGDPYAVHMKRLNIYDPIRNTPRFQALLKQINMYP